MLRSSVVSWFAAILFLSLGAIAAAQDSGNNSEGPISAEAAKKLKSPVPCTKKSIAKGRGLFARSCTGCHGPDGKATVDVVANATDLTSPKLYQSGTSEGEIFRSIRDGQGASMPSFKSQIHSEEEIWNLVNFIRSLWPESMRPPLEEDKEADGNKTK
jgi:mono/diheme cytochrome c family protein